MLWISKDSYRLAAEADEKGLFVDQEFKVKLPLHESLIIRDLIRPHSKMNLKYRVLFCRVGGE